jgi:hypothetical protein
MSAHIEAFHAATGSAVATPFQIKFGVLTILPAVVLLLAGCTDAPRLRVVGPDPADPGARAPRVNYRSTIGPYKSQRPVEPGPWGEQNQGVAPQPKSGHEGHR